MILHVVAHVTLLLILAFFVLFAASRADGFVKLLGTLLGYWLVLVAVLIVAACVTRPMFGGKPFGMDMHGAHGDWMHHGWMHSDQAASPAAAPAPSPMPAPAPAPAAAPAKPAGH
ncbi:MAG: hypothetical protein ABSD74_02190 [Rhizomicrobium sp.]|jgi:hypothetical protein